MQEYTFARMRLDPRVIFGNNMRLLRHKKGMSQETLADESGLHRTYIGGVERGEGSGRTRVDMNSSNLSLPGVEEDAEAPGTPTTKSPGKSKKKLRASKNFQR